MFNFIEKIVDKLQAKFLNRNQSPSYKQKQRSSYGDNVGRDKITIYNNSNADENLRLKERVKSDNKKLGYFREFNKHLKKVGIIQYIEAGVNFNSTTAPHTASINPKSDYIVWQNSLTITTRAVELVKISFKINGNAYNTDFKDFKLYIDKSFVEGVINSDGIITFDLTYSPKILSPGTKVLELVVNINNSASGKYFAFSLVKDDTIFIDPEMNSKIEPTTNGKEFKEITSGEQTVN